MRGNSNLYFNFLVFLLGTEKGSEEETETRHSLHIGLGRFFKNYLLWKFDQITPLAVEDWGHNEPTKIRSCSLPGWHLCVIPMLPHSDPRILFSLPCGPHGVSPFYPLSPSTITLFLLFYERSSEKDDLDKMREVQKCKRQKWEGEGTAGEEVALRYWWIRVCRARRTFCTFFLSFPPWSLPVLKITQVYVDKKYRKKHRLFQSKHLIQIFIHEEAIQYLRNS